MKTIVFLIISLVSLNGFTQVSSEKINSVANQLLTNEENKIAESVKDFAKILDSQNIPFDLTNLTFSIHEESSSIFKEVFSQENETVALCKKENVRSHMVFSKKVLRDKNFKLVVWHELAHCLFNLNHNLRDVESIMFPYKDPVVYKKLEQERKQDFYEELRASQFDFLNYFNLSHLFYDKYEKIVLIDLIKVRTNQLPFDEEDIEMALLALEVSQINPHQIKAQDHRAMVKFIDIIKKTK